MGQTLSEPIVEKYSEKGEDDRLLFGLSSMQGWRIQMEDAHAAILDLQNESTDKPPQKESRLSFFGVYDGHGGNRVAVYSGSNVHKIVARQPAFEIGDYDAALREGFLATDRAILQDQFYKEELSGCTASVALVSQDKIYVANAGDSRTVLGVKGRVKPLSFDHKPVNEAEKARIIAAGGFVDFGRVNGNLALSRAIGDFEFKKNPELCPEQQVVTAYPDVITHEISPDDEFIVLACDGIWDCQPSHRVVEFVRRGIVQKQELDVICENLMDKCLAHSSDTNGVGCDNMTMIIVGLLQGKTKEEWYEMIAKRVADGEGPCAPPEYADQIKLPWPRYFEDSPDEFDNYGSSNNRSFRTNPSRVIVLGDGTEVLSDTEDAEMYDDEDKDEETLEKNKKSKLEATREANIKENPIDNSL